MTALLYCPALLSAQTPDLLVCFGRGYTLTNEVAATGASQVTYAWTESANPVDNSNTASLSVAAGKAPGTYTYVRTASSDDCPDPVSSNAYTVVVVPMPAVPVISASAAEVCHNAADIAFTIPPADNTVYNWSGTDGAPSGTGNGTYTVSGGVTGSKEVTATASVTYTVASLEKACTSDASAPASATVHPRPVVAQVPYDEDCGSGEKNLEVSVTVGGSPLALADITWYAGETGNDVLESGTSYTTPNLTETTHYYVAATDETTGCESVGRTQVEATLRLYEGRIGGSADLW
jgi:hypothetical protein